MIDTSSGGLAGLSTAAPIKRSLGFQVPFAAAVKRGAAIPTMAVGLILDGPQAEKILQDGDADLIAIGRQALYNPFWPVHAAQALGCDADFEMWNRRVRLVARQAQEQPAARATPTTGQAQMTGILAGLRIVEGSAFIAAPMAGMTLAQLGADVIRFDDIKGGLDQRPLAGHEGRPVDLLGRPQQGQALDRRRPAQLDEGPRAADRADHRAGRGRAASSSTNMPARGWLSYEELAKKRADLIALNIVGDRHGAANVDYTVNSITGFPLVTGPAGHQGPVNDVLPAWDIATAYAGAWRSWRPSGIAG